MQTTRTTALLAALALAFGLACTADAQSAQHPNQEAIDHIRLLEQMLLDAGVQPPVRPVALLTQPQPKKAKPIVPPSFASVVLETEVNAINARGDKAADAIKHVRRWLNRDDVKRRVAAEDVIKAIAAWSEQQMQTIENTDDPVWAYILADDAIHLLGQDALVKPFKQYMMNLRRDRSEWNELESMAAYRRTLTQAQDVGLLGDWELIDFQNTSVRTTIKAITTKLNLITSNWPKTEAGQAAQAKLDEWAAREAQAIADLPAWRYTWQLALIQTGTEQETTIITTANGDIIIDEDQRAVYDPNRIRLNGTFQNTSDKAYRYTFRVGVTSNFYNSTPFSKLTENQLIGYELVQTPYLAPGELHKWEVELSVKNIRNLNRGGVGKVEAHERKARR